MAIRFELVDDTNKNKPKTQPRFELVGNKNQTKVKKQEPKKDLLSTIGYLGKEIGKGYLGIQEGIAKTAGVGLQLAGKATSALADNPVGEFVFGKSAGDYENNPLYQIGSDLTRQDVTSMVSKPLDKAFNQKSYIKPTSFVGQLPQAVGGVIGAIKNPIGGLKGTAVSTFGTGFSQAEKSGGTMGQNIGYGALNSAIETGTESLFGGIGKAFGKGALDDVIAKGVGNKIKNKVASTLAQMGIKAIGEGTEEIIASVLNPVAQKLTYLPEEDLKKLYKDTDLLRDFLAGAIVSSVVQLPSVSMQIKTDKQQIAPESTITPQQPQIPQEQVKSGELQPIYEKIKQDRPGLDITENPNIESNGIYIKNADGTRTITVNPNSPKAELLKEIPKKEDLETNTIISNNNEYKLKTPEKVSLTNDFYRNIRQLFDKKSADKITRDFDNGKLNYVKLNNKLAKSLKENIVDKYGIKKGSKDSELVQKYGEGIITLDELKQQTDNYENVVEADKYFRKMYDTLIDEINTIRKQIYPNVEKQVAQLRNDMNSVIDKISEKNMQLGDAKKGTKRYTNIQNQILNLKKRLNNYDNKLQNDELLKNRRVEKRKDYYRHFQEMSEGFKGLANLLTTSADISPQMIGISEYTKPKTKFSSIAQKRKGVKTKYDAVGGFINYIPSASFMINIDPQINNLRTLTNDLKIQMGEDTSANKAISFLTKFTDQIAGKTNFLDRPVQELVSRKAMKGVDFIQGRIKSNIILGNVSSSLSQVLNLPQIVGKVKNPIKLIEGFKDTLNKNTDYSKSQFITERYESDILSQFDNSLLNKPKKFATWMTQVLDEKVTKIGWNALYRQAIEKNIDNPIQYADNNIRDLVAGRGIGEKTLLQESKVISTLAPFTVEVGNLSRVLKDFGRNKDILGLLITFITANLLNKAIKEIGGGGKTFDPIEAVKDALTEEDISLLERLGRVGGEVLSALPAGQIVAQLYPEYGTKTLPTRKKLFGEYDPTRFGTGSMYSKIFQKPLTTVITPFAGSQIEKTYQAIQSIKKSAVYKNDKMLYPIDTDTKNVIKGALFGKFKETDEYYEKNRRPLSENQAKQVEESGLPKETYKELMLIREYNKLLKEYNELKKADKDTTRVEEKISNLK